MWLCSRFLPRRLTPRAPCFQGLIYDPTNETKRGKGALTWPKLLTLLNDIFNQIFSMLMCSLHLSPSHQVQNGHIFVKNIVFERTFSAQNNAIPAIPGVVNMAII